jgi:hypothetical protein
VLPLNLKRVVKSKETGPRIFAIRLIFFCYPLEKLVRNCRELHSQGVTFFNPLFFGGKSKFPSAMGDFAGNQLMGFLPPPESYSGDKKKTTTQLRASEDKRLLAKAGFSGRVTLTVSRVTAPDISDSPPPK